MNDHGALVFWGTYDLGKPRVRLLLEGARRAGFDVLECHAEVWSGVEDKSQLSGWRRITRALRWCAAYPGLLLRYCRLPRHRSVVVPYLGQVDVLLLWPIARWRGARIYFDAFLSLYDTVVHDRRLVSPRSPVAATLWLLEALACRAADRVFCDTDAHARYFESTFRLPSRSVMRVPVGAEEEFRAPPLEAEAKAGLPFTVLFYGQFIPLHGLETVVRAAALLAAEGVAVRWRLVGQGQEAERIDALLAELGLVDGPTPTVERVAWIPYADLAQELQRADLCLGIFGAGAKASRVIPNKVFQVIAARRPLITADTPAAREWLHPSRYLRLVPAADPEALAVAVAQIRALPRQPAEVRRDLALVPAIFADDVGRQLARLLLSEGEERS